MNELEYKFEVLEPELPEATVGNPQLLSFNDGVDTVKVIVYFMVFCETVFAKKGWVSGLWKEFDLYEYYNNSNGVGSKQVIDE